MIRSQLNISFLITSGPDQSVDFSNFNFVKLFDGFFDLVFVAFRVNDEDEGVVVFDLFHGGFGGEWEFHDDGRGW